MPDNYSQWEWHERESELWLAKKPRCCRCCEPIQDDRAWLIAQQLYCEECAEEAFKIWTEDYIR